MNKNIDARISHKRDTEANWETNNPVLLNGELILIDTADGKLRTKIGDGVTTYSQLPFVDNDYVKKSGDTMTGVLGAPYIETGTTADSYFQSQRFRGEGDASTYYHAVDFGYAGNDKVEFFEYGGIYNFYKCTDGLKENARLIGAITENGFEGNATSATKATQDENGNNIANTYATKEELSADVDCGFWDDSVDTIAQLASLYSEL